MAKKHGLFTLSLLDSETIICLLGCDFLTRKRIGKYVDKQKIAYRQQMNAAAQKEMV